MWWYQVLLHQGTGTTGMAFGFARAYMALGRPTETGWVTRSLTPCFSGQLSGMMFGHMPPQATVLGSVWHTFK